MRSMELLQNTILNIGEDFLVVDVNVIISAVLGIGNSSIVFELNKKEKKFKFVAPEFLFIEIGKHTERIAKKTNYSLEEAQEAIEFIFDQITFVSDEKFKNKFKEAREILKEHEKDVHYLALALKLNCDILSGDKKFKELCPDKIKSPREILEEFEN